MRVILLGSQAQPTVGSVMRSSFPEGPFATVTAGWQEREPDDGGLNARLGGRVAEAVAEALAEAVAEALGGRVAEALAAVRELDAAQLRRRVTAVGGAA